MHSEGRYGLERQMAGWWRLKSSDEGVNDIIGANDTTLSGGASLGTTGGRGCAIFDGIDGRATVGAMTGVNNAVFTVSMWFRQTSVGASNKTLFGVDDHAGNYGFLIYCYNGVVQMPMGAAWAFHDSASFISVNTWHHLAIVVTATDVLIYADGVLSTTTALVSAPTYSGSTPNLTIGSDYDTNTGYRNFFDGSISDVRIYNRALSAAEVARLARIY